MTYRITPFPAMLSDSEDHSAIGKPFWSAMYTRSCTSWQDFSWQRVARSLCNGWSTCTQRLFNMLSITVDRLM